jgi:hypothetical protein
VFGPRRRPPENGVTARRRSIFINNLIIAKFTPADKAKMPPAMKKSAKND